MEYRKLGNTGLEVSVIALGCEAFVEDNSNAKKFLDMAEAAGVNYFDLFSPDPAARSALGEAMEGRREKFIIQSHISSVWKNGQYERSRVPDTERMHYEVLEKHAGDCLQCGMCETRCPFDVKIRDNMKHAEKVFGY